MAANVPVRKFSMPFEAATAKYGRIFLDGFYPAKGSTVNLLYLPGVTFNLLDEGFSACATSAPVGRIELCGFEAEPTLPGNAAVLTGGQHVPVSKQAKGKVDLRFRIAAEPPAGTMEADDAAAAAAAAASPYPGPEPSELEGLHWTVEKKKAAPAAAAAAGADAAAVGGAGAAAPADGGKKAAGKKADASAAKGAAAPAAGSEPADCTPGATSGDEVAPGAGRGGEGQLVTPWEVEAEDEGGIDYDKLIRDFGCSYITVSA